MPRPPRFSYAHAVHHVTLRCNNREFLFSEPAFELFIPPPTMAFAPRWPMLKSAMCIPLPRPRQ